MRYSITLRSTCYNHEEFVVECLDSVARQDCGGFEWIIVDDASTDGSRKRIEDWLGHNNVDLRRKGIAVEFIAHEKNIGFAATLNEIVERATGDCLCGVSCDDRLLPARISTVRRMMSELPEGFAGIYGDAYVIDAGGRRTEPRFIERHCSLASMPGEDLFDILLVKNFIPAPSVALFRQVLKEIGGYDESLPYEDYDLWLRLTRQHRLAYYEEPTVEYRVHGRNFHLKFTNWRQANYWIYRKHIDLESGARRFVGNLKGLLKHGEITGPILDDVRGLCLGRQPGWVKLKNSVLSADSGDGKRL